MTGGNTSCSECAFRCIQKLDSANCMAEHTAAYRLGHTPYRSYFCHWFLELPTGWFVSYNQGDNPSEFIWTRLVA